MEKEAIEQLLDSNDVEDNILGIIISDSLGIELGNPAYELNYSRVYRRDWINHTPGISGDVFLNNKRYWINAYGIFELTDKFTFISNIVFYDDGSLNEHL